MIMIMDDNSLWRNEINEDNYRNNVHKTRWKQLLNENSFEVQQNLIKVHLKILQTPNT